ncbi:MAG: hypothetical protein IPL39_07365 [Opitutaceae bacterium]|nr:hypothetical protein [Opitutaceae bacterium]
MASSPSAYRPVFSATAVALFVSLPRRRQRRLWDRAHELAADPFLVADFTNNDTDSRAISHLLLDDFLLDDWVDHAAKTAKIVGIDDAS